MNLNTLQLQRATRSITDPWQWRPDSATAALAIRRRVETPAGIAPTLTRRDGLGRSAVGSDLKALASLTGPGAAPMRSETAVTTASYQTRKYRLEELIPDEVAQASNQVMLDAIAAAARRLQAHLLRDLDHLLIRQLLTKSLWPVAGVATLTTGASGTSWASHASANSDPLGNIRAARAYIALTTGRPATHIAMTADVLDYLADHPAIGGALKYTDPGAIIKEGPGAVKGLTLVPITTAYDSTPAADDPTPAWMFKDQTSSLSCAIVYAASDDFKPVTYFDGIGPTSGRHAVAYRVYRDEPAGAYIVDAETQADMQLTATDATGDVLGAYAIWSAIV